MQTSCQAATCPTRSGKTDQEMREAHAYTESPQSSLREYWCQSCVPNPITLFIRMSLFLRKSERPFRVAEFGFQENSDLQPRISQSDLVVRLSLTEEPVDSAQGSVTFIFAAVLVVCPSSPFLLSLLMPEHYVRKECDHPKKFNGWKARDRCGKPPYQLILGHFFVSSDSM